MPDRYIPAFSCRPENPKLRPPYQGSNPISDVWCLEGIKLMAKYLKRSVEDPEDIEARTQMHLARYPVVFVLQMCVYACLCDCSPVRMLYVLRLRYAHMHAHTPAHTSHHYNMLIEFKWKLSCRILHGTGTTSISPRAPPTATRNIRTWSLTLNHVYACVCRGRRALGASSQHHGRDRVWHGWRAPTTCALVWPGRLRAGLLRS